MARIIWLMCIAAMLALVSADRVAAQSDPPVLASTFSGRTFDLAYPADWAAMEQAISATGQESVIVASNAALAEQAANVGLLGLADAPRLAEGDVWVQVSHTQYAADAIHPAAQAAELFDAFAGDSITSTSAHANQIIYSTPYADVLIMAAPLRFNHPAYKSILLVSAAGSGDGYIELASAILDSVVLTTLPPTAAVEAMLGWQSTTINMVAGEIYRLQVVAGTWTHYLGVVGVNNGQGDPNYICAAVAAEPTDCVEPLPTAPAGSLIGRVGDEDFFIGHGTVFIPQTSGPLSLRVNDGENGLYDNTGRLVVMVQGPVQNRRPGLNTFTVEATLGWQSSSLSITPGDTITIRVIGGTWTQWLSQVPPHRGQNVGYVCADVIENVADCVEPIPSAASGSLIARVGEELFVIGAGSTITPSQDGVLLLLLRINDGDSGLADNGGYLAVLIVTPAYEGCCEE